MDDSTRALPAAAPERTRLSALSTDDILWAVSRRAFDAGRDYWSSGRVLEATLAPGGTMLDARVQGSEAEPYSQAISLHRSSDGKLAINGDCTCPVGHNCKHVAAALIAFQQQPRPELPAPVPLGAYAEGAPPAPSLSTLMQPDVDAWLRKLDEAQTPETDEYPPTVRKRLLYVLDHRGGPEGTTVSLISIELKRDGSIGPARGRHALHQLTQPEQQPKFLRPSDRRILRRLSAMDEQDVDFIDVLKMLASTGRGRWGSWDGPALHLSGPVAATLGWTVSEDGLQHPVLEIPEPLVALKLATPWYVDPTTGAVGPLETEQPPEVIRVMLGAPWLPREAAARVREEMSRRWPDRRLPVPAVLAAPELLRAPLQPRLRLIAGVLNQAGSDAAPYGCPPEVGAPGSVVPLARASLRYGPVDLAPDAIHDVVAHQGRLVQVVRDVQGEGRVAERLRYLGFQPAGQMAFMSGAHPHLRDLLMTDPDPDVWVQFLLDDVPQLRDEGWQIEIDDAFPVRIATPSGDLSFEISESSGIDWFDLDLGVMVDGARVSLVPVLLQVINDPEMLLSVLAMLSDYEPEEDDEPPPMLLPLPDGRLLAIPFAKLRPILAPLLELFAGVEVDPNATTLRLSRRDAGDLALLEAASAEAGIAWAGGDAVRALGRMLREHGGIPPCTAPPGFGAELRAYQEHGLAWLQFLASAGLGGVLADDMGLGKTVQALAHLAVEQAAGRLDRPALVICPTSLVANWRAEAARFAPSLRTLVLHGPDRAGRFGDIAAHDLVVTTYPLLARDHAVLTATEWHVVVLDEAQMIKNPLAATSKLARDAASPPAALPVGHAAGEPSRRAVVAVRLPDARLPRRPPGLRTPLPRADRERRRPRTAGSAGAAHRTLPAATDQAGCGCRPAPQDGDYGGHRDGLRTARHLRGHPSRHARQGARGDQAARPGPVRHHHPRRPAQAAPGLL